MTGNDWMRLVRAGEGLNVEFKRQAPKLERLSRSFSAFANSSGGFIFFGIDDDGAPYGLEHLQGTQDLIGQVAAFACDPPVAFKTHVWEPLRGKTILVVEIDESAEKPVYAVNPHAAKDAWPFFRSGKENLPLDRQSLKTMRHDRSVPVERAASHLDRHTIHILNRLDETPRVTVTKLARAVNISVHRAKKILVELEQFGWVHSFFNEKRREFSLAIPWKKR